jgi:3-isopropylmalate dehydrogenase
MIASIALLLRHSLNLHEEALALEKAMRQVIAAGVRTTDIAVKGGPVASTTEMTDAIIQRLK